jgi:Ca2+-binding EF-hand superfamily protein
MGKYCFLHKKIIKDKILRLLSRIQKAIKYESWKHFVEALKKSCDISYPNQIHINKFFKIMKHYEINVNDEDRDDITECFHLKDEGNTKEINIQPVFDFDKTKAVDKLYKTIDLEKKEDEEELSLTQQRLMPISEDYLLKVLTTHPNMNDLWKQTRKQDLDANGFLTLSELNVTFQSFYPDLEGKSLFKVFRPFASVQNKSLVDYKKFREYITNRLSAYMSSESNGDNAVKEMSRNIGLGKSATVAKETMPFSPVRGAKSPSMMRMEQAKGDILRAAESSPLLLASINLAKQQNAQQPPEININRKTALEALISPRGNKLNLKSLKRFECKLSKTGERIMSPVGRSIASRKFSQYSAF